MAHIMLLVVAGLPVCVIGPILTKMRWILFTALLSVVAKDALADTCTTTTANLTVATIQAAINTAGNGATVCVPPGSATWTTAITIPSTKSITLQGAGVGVTNITHNRTGSQAHLIEANAHATLHTRITGFSFLSGTYDRRFILMNNTETSASYRIDHNSFVSTGNAIQIDSMGGGKGLIDHNSLQSNDNFELIHGFGTGTAGWTNVVVPGSDNAIYVEDNTFTNTNTADYGAASCLQSYDGARTVVRYNTFNFCQVDQHGTAGMIGARWWEIYENSFWVPSGGNQFAYGDIRGGSGVMFNNHKIGFPNSGAGFVQFREEDTGYPALYQVGRGQNQILDPAYFWNNDAAIDDSYPTPTMVKSGRDVLLSAKPGYSPYTYPHPLTTAVPPVIPNAPTSLRIIP